jgi:hypothetical protein
MLENLVKAGELGYNQHLATAKVKAPAAALNHQIQLSTLADQLT